MDGLMEEPSSELIQRLRIEIDEKQRQIDCLQRELFSLRKNTHRGVEEDDNDNNDNEENTLTDKIRNHLSHLYQNRQEPIYKAELYLSVINCLATLYHLDYDESLDTEEFDIKPLITDFSNVKGKMKQQLMIKASKVAFNYSIGLFRQLNEQKLKPDSGATEVIGFPIQWLLGIFPAANNVHFPKSDTMWLPVHLFLAYQPDPSQLDLYLEDLNLLLLEFGEAAFQEEVSPLSVAVSKSEPILSVIQRIMDFKPQANNFEDDDGSIPIHHACACNETTEIVRYFYSLDSKSIEKVDNFGASAIHYATFSGHMDVVKYLLDVQPLCVQYAEGNGALPLHDAVQNSRGRYHQAEITELLLQLCPEAATKRDSEGAFPFHRAVKASTQPVAEMLISAFPNAVFAADSEGLLPIHYFSQREDKDTQLELLEYILSLNPKGTTLSESELFPKAKTSKTVFSFFGGGGSQTSSKATEGQSIGSTRRRASKRGSVVKRRMSVAQRTRK